MAKLAIVLREEIQRLARKEVRKAVSPLKKEVTRLRRDVAELKRLVAQLARDTKRVVPEVARLRRVALDPKAKEVKQARFGPKLIAALRRRLKLSRAKFGRLAGVSSNTVYLWESGNTAPRDKARAALLDLRRIGVREAKRRLKDAAS